MAKTKASKNTEAPDKEEERQKKKEGPDFYIAAIGSSAGGLDPLKQLLGGIKPGSGIAYVVISHLDPHHSSMLPELLQRSTPLKVMEIVDNLPIQPDTIYVIKPGCDLTIAGSGFRLETRAADHVSFPINTFFTSLADRCGEQAIAVVLSGTGTDGMIGARAVKDQFGLVIAQEPATAQYKGMPLAVVSAQVVDAILAPEKIGPYIADFVANRVKRLRKGEPEKLFNTTTINRICALIERRTGHDFSGYKHSTLIRRIGRRMDLHRLEGVDQYIERLQDNPDEVDALFGELLIGVTSFFRDPQAWDIMKQKVLPMICQGKEHGAEVRVWVPGVSTGEEAYSMAILFDEYMNEHNISYKLTIFATDIDERAVEKARKGLYPAAISADLSKERLERYFVRQDNALAVRRDVRESIIFAPQNLLKDPPFSKLDLICCRNLLIYLNAGIQRRLIPVFHYSLSPNGVLFLGSSEGIGDFGDLFTAVDGKWKIYKRISDEKQHLTDFPMTQRAPERPHPAPREDLFKLIGQRLLDDFVPACAVIDQDGKIQYIHGRTGKYLEPAPGEAQLDIFRMAREGLQSALQAAVHQAVAQNHSVERSPVKVKTNGDSVRIKLRIKPLLARKDGNRLLTVVFEELVEPKEPATGQRAPQDRSVEELEQELRNTRENLQSTVEELETSNEELRSMNEEYQSTNEELKSANEELETSREELQSLNEELTTVNSELQEKISNLSVMQKEMQMFLNSLDIPTVFLDDQLRLVRFTTQASAIFHIIDSDVGRPIQHFASTLHDPTLIADAKEVLKTLQYSEKEVQTTDGHWYLRRTLPYRSTESHLQGLAVNFVDIHSFKTAADKLAKIETVVGSMTDVVNEPLIVLDSQFKVLRASNSFYERFKLDAEQSLGKSLFEIAGTMVDAEVIRNYLLFIEEGKKIESITTRAQVAGQTFDLTVRAQKVAYGPSHVWCVVFKVSETH